MVHVYKKNGELFFECDVLRVTESFAPKLVEKSEEDVLSHAQLHHNSLRVAVQQLVGPGIASQRRGVVRDARSSLAEKESHCSKCGCGSEHNNCDTDPWTSTHWPMGAMDDGCHIGGNETKLIDYVRYSMLAGL